MMIQEVQNKDLLFILKLRTGGITTIRIIDELLKSPYNKNQLSKKLNLDYKTITYHMEILCKYDYVVEEKFEKSYFYHASEKLFKNMDEYKLIKETFKEEKGN